MHKFVTLILLFALVVNPASTVLPQVQSGAKFKVYSDLVLVDAVVTDKKGNPIRNLAKKDFHIFEDGVEQSIEVFRFEDVSQFEAERAKEPPPPLPAPTAAPPAQPVQKTLATQKAEEARYSNRRLIVMMFDLASLDIPDAIFARKSAEEFIHTRIAPADLMAVVVMSATLRVVQDFTNDQSLLLAALNKVKLGQSSELVAQGATDTTSGDITGTAENTNEDTSDAYSLDETQFNIFNTDRKLMAIESVAKMLKDLPEKKSLIHFSSGLQTTGIENQSQLEATISAANRSNMSIYAVDARGLIATPAGGDASHGGTGGTAMFSGASQRSGLSNIDAAQETLTTLSEDTGGRAFLDTNDLGQVFDQVQSDTNTYYLLGYYSNNTKHDGRFRKIKVTVDEPETKLRFRPGYFAPKEFGQFTKSEREHQLDEAINTDSPFTDLPFILGAYSFKAEDPQNPKNNQMFVPVSLRLPSSDVPFAAKKDRKEADFDFVGQVRDPAHGDAMVSYVRDVIHLKLDDATYSRIAAGGSIQYDTGFYLRPGHYKMKFLIREDQTGKMGSFEQALMVPDLSKQPLKMSSVILSSQLQAAEQQGSMVRKDAKDTLLQEQDKIPNPLIQDQKKIVPNVGHVFSAKQTLYVFFQVYQPGVDPEKKKPHVDLALLFFRNGKKVYETPEYEVAQFKGVSSDVVDCNFSVPLSQLSRGRYTLQLIVTDRIADTHTYQRLPFVIR
ncbi:MAG: VWA domain-containing protein [Terriglobia bacterium]